MIPDSPYFFKLICFILLMTLLNTGEVRAQYMNTADPDTEDSLETYYHPQRGKVIALTAGAVYAGGMTALYSTWYSQYPRSDFHLFNDGNEWLQMDKVGHAASAYYLARWNSDLMKWVGANNYRSAWIGAGAGMVFLSTVEVFDGFSDEWGFSIPDMIANASGTALFLSQALTWGDQRISMKFSYHTDPIAQSRPEVFGDNLSQNILKDYNGQTYWLSFNLKSLARIEKVPSWFNIAIGYGAGNMYSGENSLNKNDFRYRQFYFSPDIDWTRIPVRKKWQSTLLKIIGCIKIPAPAVEIRQGQGLVFHGIYF